MGTPHHGQLTTDHGQPTQDHGQLTTDHAQLAILLIAHGSRRAEANDDLLRLAGQVRERVPAAIVEAAYLELAEPSVPAAAARCIEQGATEIRLLPYFLSPGMHVTRDLEDYRRQFAGRHPGVEFVLCPPLGPHPLIVETVLERLGPLPP
jgi:sirohydrochlorin ferrochelatase